MPDKLYQRIYLSPHLDDAALSCGGRIYQERQAGLSVLVLTVMAGDPPSETPDTPYLAEIHTRWKLQVASNPVMTRRAEDKEALAILAADFLHWEWADCIYRRHPETDAFLYTSDPALFGSVHPAEMPLIEHLAHRLADLPLAPQGQLFAPLTIGGHVDHQIVRQAAEMGNVSGAEIVYYEDYPYSEQPDALAAVLGDESAWRAETVPLDKKAMTAKEGAVACYRSQLSTFFVDQQEMALRLRAYATSINGREGWAERYWHPPAPSDHQP